MLLRCSSETKRQPPPKKKPLVHQTVLFVFVGSCCQLSASCFAGQSERQRHPHSLQGQGMFEKLPWRVSLDTSGLVCVSESASERVNILIWTTTLCRKRRMKTRSERSITLAWAKVSLFSTTRTTASSCTPSTCSPWSPCSLTTSPWTRRSASSARHTERTSNTATKTATKDALTLSWQSARDLSRDESSRSEINKM